MRCEMEDALDQARAAPRNLLELPPVLHGQAEADRHRRPRRAVHEEVRRPDGREPQEGSRGEVRQEARSRNTLDRQFPDGRPSPVPPSHLNTTFSPASARATYPCDARRRRSSAELVPIACSCFSTSSTMTTG